MPRFVPNPSFDAEFDRGLGRAIEDKAADIRDVAKRNTKHPSVARRITARPVKRDAKGPFAEVTTGGGLGNIFEGGTKERSTLGRGKYAAGANRGSIDAERAIERAVESEVPKGLDMDRYL